ncbi:MAG: hypothetical protein A2X08_02210 [Bacteroidetes bacterium GWA2_32_17]|nr:MAG: hypothetical protein A2X08_02210 [Bacteroidetes bacterium GWA2_32_17]
MEEQTLQPNSAPVNKKLGPHAISALIWGIFSIVTMMYLGWVASIIGFAQRSKGLRVYNENPGTYSEKTLNVLRTAKTLNLIGLIVSISTTVLFLLVIIAATM